LYHPREVRAAVFGADGRTVVTGCDDGAARVWTLAAGSLPTREPLHHLGHVLATAMRGDGQAVVTGSVDTNARVWDLKTGEVKLLPHPNQVRAVACGSQTQTVLSASRNLAYAWDVNKVMARTFTHPGDVAAMALNCREDLILTAGADGKGQ